MNTMGKILVFLNLLFALVVGGFLIVDFGARQDWKERAEAYRKEVEAAYNDALQFRAYKQEAQAELAKLHQQLQQKQVQLAALDAERKKEAQDWENKFKEASETASKQALSQTVTEKENERLALEAKLLRDQKEQLEGTIVALEAKMDQIVQLYQQALNDRSSVESRNLAMLQQLRQLELEVAKSRTAAAAGTTADVRDRNGPNPPGSYLKGVVKKVEGGTNNGRKDLVEISLGSDHGLKQGHTLEMYRFVPDAEYIGLLRIDQVEPRTAVGRVIRGGVYGTTKNPRVGDEVASRIVPR